MEMARMDLKDLERRIIKLERMTRLAAIALEQVDLQEIEDELKEIRKKIDWEQAVEELPSEGMLQ